MVLYTALRMAIEDHMETKTKMKLVLPEVLDGYTVSYVKAAADKLRGGENEKN